MRTGVVILGAGIGAAFALYLYSRTDKGAAVVSDIADSTGETVSNVVSAVRGIRNNNPGNIRKGADKWQGLAPDQTDPAFLRFVSMAYGVRAMVKIIRNYSTRYNLNTVGEIINRWAPPTENNTGAYARAVADALRVTTTARIDVDDAATMFSLVRAIIAHENGRIAAMLVSDSSVWQGIELA
jgi:hypothetical protein